tara:strand:+ start:51 stop:770 length:720 start_codon:yes stop_codon:yes gene_type:complete
MSRGIIKRSLIVITGLFIGGGFLTACGGGGEESQLIRAFFQASRFNDRTTVGNMSMVFFPPEEEGIASSPSIDSMQEEQRVPLRMQELSEALVDAREAEEEFRDEKRMYQDENEETIGRVIEAQRAEEDIAEADEEIQEMWNSLVVEERSYAQSVSDATAAVNQAVQIASASVFDPSNPIDVTAYDGDIVTKDLTVTVSVEKDGSSSDRTMMITIQKAEIRGGESDELVDSRWIITSID